MFSQNELILMIMVVSVLLVFIIVLTILDIKEYKKNKDIDVSENVGEEQDVKEEIVSIESKEKEVIEVEEVKEENITFEKEEQQEEVFFEELESEVYDSVPVEPEISYETYTNKEIKIDLPNELDKIEETIEPDGEKIVTSFEEEQERTAIISLDELLKKSDNLYQENENIQYDDGNEPISLDEILNMYNKENDVAIPEVMQEIEIKEEKEEKKELYSKKESIPFISSIYGIENNEMSFENTANFEKFDRESNNEFMRRLKEMNNNK